MSAPVKVDAVFPVVAPVALTLQFVSTGGGGGDVSSVFGRTGAILAVEGDYTATKITNTPAGNIAATNVQAALNELDSEKVGTGDSRLSDARTPTAHAASHKHSGGDEVATATAAANAIPKAGAGAKLDVGWLPVGTGATDVCAGNDARLSDARSPVVHATTHKSAGGDPIKLDELAAPTDVTTLNATTSAHGLLPKLDNDPTHFLSGVGTYITPTVENALLSGIYLPGNANQRIISNVTTPALGTNSFWVRVKFACPSSNPASDLGLFAITSASTGAAAASAFTCYLSTLGYLYIILYGAGGTGDSRYLYNTTFLSTYAGKTVDLVILRDAGTPTASVWVNGAVVAFSASTSGTPPAWSAAVTSTYISVGNTGSSKWLGDLYAFQIGKGVIDSAMVTQLLYAGCGTGSGLASNTPISRGGAIGGNDGLLLDINLGAGFGPLYGDSSGNGITLLSNNRDETHKRKIEYLLGTFATANLPAAPTAGTHAWCTDCLTPQGTGAMVFYDGTYWRTIPDNIIATTSIETYLRSSLTAGQRISTAWDLVDWDEFETSSSQVYAAGNANSGAATTGTVAGAGRSGVRYCNTTGTAQYPINYSQADYVMGTYGACLLSLATLTSSLSDSGGSPTNAWNSRWGWQDGQNSNTLQANGIYFSYDTQGTLHAASPNYYLVIRNGSTNYYEADSGVAVAANTYQMLSIWVNAAATEVKFFINGTQVGTTQTSNIPTATMRHVFTMSRTAGTASRTVSVDWLRLHLRRPSAASMGGI